MKVIIVLIAALLVVEQRNLWSEVNKKIRKELIEDESKIDTFSYFEMVFKFSNYMLLKLGMNFLWNQAANKCTPGTYEFETLGNMTSFRIGMLNCL